MSHARQSSEWLQRPQVMRSVSTCLHSFDLLWSLLAFATARKLPAIFDIFVVSEKTCFFLFSCSGRVFKLACRNMRDVHLRCRVRLSGWFVSLLSPEVSWLDCKRCGTFLAGYIICCGEVVLICEHIFQKWCDDCFVQWFVKHAPRLAKKERPRKMARTWVW